MRYNDCLWKEVIAYGCDTQSARQEKGAGRLED
jgi:hypothetical protein